jgi:hypothetical protein
MTRGTDLGTDTMPRTFLQASGRPAPPGRAPAPSDRVSMPAARPPVPSGRTTPPGRTTAPTRTTPPGRTPPGGTTPLGRTAPPPQGRTAPPTGRAVPPPGRAMPPSGRTMPPGRTEPSPTGRTRPPGRTEPPTDHAMLPGRAKPPRRAKPSRRSEAPDRADRRRRPNPDAPGRARPGAGAGARDPRTRPLSAPRHTRPAKPPRARTGFKLSSRRAAWAAAAARPRPRHKRAPFLLLLVGLLGGALVSLLMISTTLAQGSFRISNLQQQNTNLARQEQLLTQQVAQAESPTQIAQEAEQFGMQQNPSLRFINLKTGKIVAGKVSTADSQINVPGYTP